MREIYLQREDNYYRQRKAVLKDLVVTSEWFGKRFRKEVDDAAESLYEGVLWLMSPWFVLASMCLFLVLLASSIKNLIEGKYNSYFLDFSDSVSEMFQKMETFELALCWEILADDI